MSMIPAFYFDATILNKLSDRYRQTFLTATPFPHVVMDNFFPEDVLNNIADEFTTPDDIDWKVWGHGKIGISDETKFGPLTRHVMSHLISATFIHFLESLTDSKNLLSDPTFNGCGLHSTGRNGRLMIHTDSNRHPVSSFHQKLNLILFLNKDWEEEYGGHLELWSKDAKQCEKKILPISNRCVIFETGTSSFHGQPQPLACPETRRRNSLAAYYFVPERPTDENYAGFHKRVHWVAVSTEDKSYFRSQKLKKFVKKITPPICIDLARYLRDRVTAAHTKH